METIEGNAQRFVFRSDDLAFGILRVLCEGDTITVAGAVCNAAEGLTVVCKGEWEHHPKYGDQFKAQSVLTRQPTHERGIVTYLKSDLIVGVGPVFAQKIYDHFGDQTLDIIKSEPGRLSEVEGVGPKKAKTLSESVHHQVAIESIMVWLFDHNISPNIATRIYREYGGQSVNILEDNPYVLIQDIFGVGFKIADSVALSMGIPFDDDKRLRNGVLHTLNQTEGGGDTAISQGRLIHKAKKVLEAQNVDNIDDRLAGLINELGDRDTIRRLPSGLYHTTMVQRLPTFYQEKNIAFTLADPRVDEFKVAQTDNILEKAAETAGLSRDDSQMQAARKLLNSRFGILTGRPGTGKTATLRLLLCAFDHLGIEPVLASPTGKAARRMSEATQRPAATIHRLLAFDPQTGQFEHDRNNPVNADLVVVDEASMLDTRLTNALCQALPENGRMILVGDNNQLPSVGAGRVLGDIIDSGVVSVNELTRIHRQAANSSIVTNAHHIIEGDRDAIENGDDFRYIDYGGAEQIAANLPSMLLDRVAPKLVENNPIDEIQVLTATHKGPIGTKNLNKRLGETFNPNPSDSLQHKGQTFGIGDKIIATRNNYELNVMNGMMGRVTGIDTQHDDRGKPRRVLRVAMETGGQAIFAGVDMDDIQPAWALTVHKTQGSEFPITVLVLDKSQSIMLERNWLYTAVTRAQKHCIIVGKDDALSHAVKEQRSERRVTLLEERLGARI